MVLEKTLNNLRKTKESFFNLERGLYINHSIAKNGLKCISDRLIKKGKNFTLERKKFLRKNGSNHNEKYRYETFIGLGEQLSVTYFDNEIVKLYTNEFRLKLV